MPRVMRRTPQSEGAYKYGYVDFLKDVVQKTLRDTTAGFKRPRDFSDEEIMEMAFAGVGGGTKIARGLGSVTDLGKRRLTNLIGDIKEGLESGDLSKTLGEMRITPERFSKNPSKYSNFLVANYKLTPLQDKEVMLKAARHILDNPEKIPSSGINMQDRARKVLMRLGKPEVISGDPTKWKMPITRPHLASPSEIPKEAAKIVEKYKSQGLTYDAYMNLLPDSPEFAYHQWTFRGEGPSRGATVTTKGTSADEFLEMVKRKMREFHNLPSWSSF